MDQTLHIITFPPSPSLADRSQLVSVSLSGFVQFEGADLVHDLAELLPSENVGDQILDANNSLVSQHLLYFRVRTNGKHILPILQIPSFGENSLDQVFADLPIHDLVLKRKEDLQNLGRTPENSGFVDFFQLEEMKQLFLVVREVLRSLDSDHDDDILTLLLGSALFLLQVVGVVPLLGPVLVDEILGPLDIRLLNLCLLLRLLDTEELLLGLVLPDLSESGAVCEIGGRFVDKSVLSLDLVLAHL